MKRWTRTPATRAPTLQGTRAAGPGRQCAEDSTGTPLPGLNSRCPVREVSASEAEHGFLPSCLDQLDGLGGFEGVGDADEPLSTELSPERLMRLYGEIYGLLPSSHAAAQGLESLPLTSSPLVQPTEPSPPSRHELPDAGGQHEGAVLSGPDRVQAAAVVDASAQLLAQVRAVGRRRFATHGDKSGVCAQLVAALTLAQLIGDFMQAERSTLLSLLSLAADISVPEWKDTQAFLICLFLAAGHTPSTHNRAKLKAALPRHWHWALQGEWAQARTYWRNARSSQRNKPVTQSLARRICQHFGWA